MNWAHFIKAYYKTPFLWDGVLSSYQLENSNINLKSVRVFYPKSKRLGNICEELFINTLSANNQVEIKAKNIQVNTPTKTLGEIDCIVSTKDLIIHLEHTFKFYLGVHSDNEIKQWLGPNKKDSLQQKLQKIQNHQFPLLHHNETKSILKHDYQLNTELITQQTVFKAQLFLPKNEIIKFGELNKDCVYGYYYKKTELADFKQCSFIIPEKMAWPLSPSYVNVNWINFDLAKKRIIEHFEREKSPMVWIKHPNGFMEKCFFVWWD